MDRRFPDNISATETDAGIRIWDVPTRSFHWLLAGCVAAAAITGFLLPVTWFSVHLAAGTIIAALIALRIVWGIWGTGESRFSSFAHGPRATWAHLQQLRRGIAGREAGHNPLGAIMVFMLLAVLAAISVTGTMVLGGTFKQGPLKSLVGYAMGMQAREAHELLAYGLLALISFHVAGVVYESRRTRENLARSMITGTKRSGFAHGPDMRRPNALAATMAIFLVGLISVGSFVLLLQRPAAGVPVMVANATWSRECAACHMAFHPSLLPAESWARIMAGLDDHFGEDASLPSGAVRDIAAFLAANAAESWDTLPANRMRRVDGKRPLEITATPFWLRTHHDISEAVFATKPVGARNNCAACHADAATGLFAPQNTAIPKESTE